MKHLWKFIFLLTLTTILPSFSLKADGPEITFGLPSPLGISLDTGPIKFLATGSPANGTFSLGESTDSTSGGLFSLPVSSKGVLLYAGATTAGSSSVEVIYTTVSGERTSKTFVIEVVGASSITFDSPSPRSVALDALPVTLLGAGAPVAGEFSFVQTFDSTKGGKFIMVDCLLGIMSYDGATVPGSTIAEITYKPLFGEPITTLYELVVTESSLRFDVPNPARFILGATPLVVEVSGTPSDGVISLGIQEDSTAGGLFTIIDASAGLFSYEGATIPGSTAVEVIYTPLTGEGTPISKFFTVEVGTTTLTFDLKSPYVSSFQKLDDCLIEIEAFGTPKGGTYSLTQISDTTSGGFFIILDPSSGMISYRTPMDVGITVAEITYTPPAGAGFPTTELFIVEIVK